ncbi:MAG TPA: fumarylacetoacetate hydrolase family protein [Allosphingosinicella sp.]|nr:fumarylacetoacetate hydrolase family protein [Allosphingosinicella sp.]
MKLATQRDGTPDGRLLVVADDLGTASPVDGIPTLQLALDRWPEAEPVLRAVAKRLAAGTARDAVAWRPETIMAPLPRAWQWLDGSAFPSHGELMQRAYNLAPIESEAPLMYQGMSHRFLAWDEDVALPAEADGIDFEAEFGVITDFVPMGTPAGEALERVRLVVQINDWSLRAIAPVEMKTGFGWVQAKPACSVAPLALTPEELGGAWRDGRIDGRMRVSRGDAEFGDVPSLEMSHGFHELIAHAARTRDLCAGTIIGSGTVSSSRFRETGSCCIAERRAIEMIETGAPVTSFLRFGERVRIEALSERFEARFGRTDQIVVQG